MVSQQENKFKMPTDQDRLDKYFWDLERVLPNPYKDWARATKPCKWLKIIKERQKFLDGQRD